MILYRVSLIVLQAVSSVINNYIRVKTRQLQIHISQSAAMKSKEFAEVILASVFF